MTRATRGSLRVSHRALVAVCRWLEVHSPGGGPPRRGLILEVIGAKRHEHYRVRWTDEHESIYFPADGATVLPKRDEPRAP